MKFLLLLFSFTLPLLGETRLSLSDQVIAPNTKIELIFDVAMVTPETIGKTLDNSILTIKPAWKTKVIWRSQNIATIVRSEAPKVATKYQFFLAKELKAVDGTIIPTKELISASSEPFQIVRSVRNGSVRAGESVLMFNDDVSPTAAAPFFQFVSPQTDTQKEQIIAARTRKATWGDLRSRYYYQPSWQRGSPTKTAALAIQLPSPPRSSSTLSLSNQSLHFQSAIFGHCDVSPHSQMPLAPPPSTRSIIMLSETLLPSPPNLLSLSLHLTNRAPYGSALTKPFQRI
jgi:hypothetical protein